MSGKFNWNGANAGREAADAAMGRDWKNGPQDPIFERPDGSDNLKLLQQPTIYWAAELKRAFPNENEEAHLDLFNAAWRSAARLYHRDGWAQTKDRSKAILTRSSRMKPFPSAFYAAYFDFCLFQVACRDFASRGLNIPRHILDYNRVEKGDIYTRCKWQLWDYVESIGYSSGFYRRMDQLEQAVWQRHRQAQPSSTPSP